MPFALIVAGIVLLVSGVRGTQGQLGTLLKGDFTGQDNFFYWFLSILLIGSLGYIEDLRPIANGFLALVIIVFIVHQSSDGGNLFQSFSNQVTQSGSTTSTSGVQNVGSVSN